MIEWLQSLSYPGIFTLLILAGLGLPIPEEVGIVYAGVQSAEGPLNPLYSLMVCLVGCVAGDCIMYGFGRWMGASWIRKHRWFAHLFHMEREKQMERLIANHGFKAFFTARFMVGLRGTLYIAAGVLKVPFRKFLIIDTISASVVIGLFFSLSYFLGGRVIGWIQRTEKWLTVLLLVAIAIGVTVYMVKHRRKKIGDDPKNDADDPTQTDESDNPKTDKGETVV